MVDTYEDQGLLGENDETLPPLLEMNEIEALNIDEFVNMGNSGDDLLGFDLDSKFILPGLEIDTCNENNWCAVSDTVPYNRRPFATPYSGGELADSDKFCVNNASCSEFDGLHSESKKKPVKEETGKVNIAGTSQEKRSSDSQRKKMLERQKRYRKNKKSKALEIEKRIQECLQEIQEIRLENERIKMTNEGLSNMADYWQESIAQTGGREILRKMDPTLSNGRVDTGIKEEVAKNGVVLAVEQVLEPFLESKEEPDEKSIQKIASFLIMNLNSLRREDCFLRLQRRVGAWLMEYLAHPSSDDVTDAITRKMNIVFESRWRLAFNIVEIAPRFVLSRLLDGWVEEDFDETLVGKVCIRVDKVSISLLVSSLNLSKPQLAEASKIWSEFVSSWNHAAGFHNKGIDNISSGSSWANTYSSGMHKGVRSSLALRHVTFSLEDTHNSQAKMILKLVTSLYKMLTTVQVARICTFYPSYAPNWVCIAKLFSRENALQS